MVDAFSGRALRRGGPADPEQVRKLQDALVQRGLLKGPPTGVYDEPTVLAVRAFQSRNSDARGEPLAVDGIVGPITWAALFGTGGLALAEPANTDLATEVIAVAQAEADRDVRETSPNRGPDVDKYVDFVGLDPAGGHDWCVCFLQWCYHQAADRVGTQSPMPFRNTKLREPGAQNLWRSAKRNGTARVTRADAEREPSLLRPASVFVLDRGGGLGHVGLVVEWRDDRLVTIEGNTAPDKGGPSNGVFRRTNRRISQVDFGFILYS